MRNRIVGFIIIGIAALIGFITFSFNRALTDIVNVACSHGSECPMWGTINFQTNVSIGIICFVAIMGLYLVLFGKEEKIITRIKTLKLRVEPKKLRKEDYHKLMGKLNSDERLVFERIIESGGTIFQTELINKTKLTKVKITRILDKLEGMNLIERKRRGMGNAVFLK